MKLPFLQFYTGDWMKDPQVSMCQPSTRGILFDALCAMHESGRSALQGTPEQLSRVLRCTSLDLSTALKDLQQTGAADVRGNGQGLVTIASRRMERDLRGRTNATNRKRKERGQPPLPTPEPLNLGCVTPSSRNGHRDISEVRNQKPEPPNPQPPAGGGGDGFLGREEIWQRVCRIVGRNSTKPKSGLEYQTLAAVEQVTDSEMVAVERYAELCRREPTKYTAPKKLAHTLLAEFHAEVGKATAALGLNGHGKKPPGKTLENWPEFVAFLRAEYLELPDGIEQWKTRDDAPPSSTHIWEEYSKWKKAR